MRSLAGDDRSRIIPTLQTALSVVVALVGLGVTWRSEGDLVTLLGVLIGAAAIALLPRPQPWRGFLGGAPLLVIGAVGLTVFAALFIAAAALLGFEGTSVSAQQFEAPR